MKQMPNISFSKSTAGSPLTIKVDDTQRFQTIDGFGAAMTEGSAWLLHDQLPAATREEVMSQLFDPNRGIGLSFLRLPLGSSDLSRSHYSYDDLPEGQTDPELKFFSVSHDDADVFPIMREALKLNPAITVMATSWSPPAWMKTRPTMNGGALREDAEPAFAAYLTRSVQAFQSAGIPIKYLTVQNEPLNETHDYPGTLMLAQQSARLIGRYVGPGLQHAGLATRVLAYDHNWDHPEYAIAVLSDPTAAPFLAGSALHCYGGDVSAQDIIHQQFPRLGIWETECSGGTWQKENPLLATAHLLVRSTEHWAKSVLLWTIILDSDHNPHAGGCGTCRGLITVDLQAAPISITYNGDFYGLGQASKFVHPGATRIASTSPGRDSVETVAFQNINGTIALYVINNRSQRSDFAVHWHKSEFRTSLPPNSVATYTWTAAIE
jgi:glucosylceramidase